MAKPRVFLCFDVDHDDDLREIMVGQAQAPDFPIHVSDWSRSKADMPSDWREDVRQRLRQIDKVVVLCGETTHEAPGANAELAIAREEDIPYALLWGRKGRLVTAPTSAKPNDRIQQWTLVNLEALA